MNSCSHGPLPFAAVIGNTQWINGRTPDGETPPMPKDPETTPLAKA